MTIIYTLDESNIELELTFMVDDVLSTFECFLLPEDGDIVLSDALDDVEDFRSFFFGYKNIRKCEN